MSVPPKKILIFGTGSIGTVYAWVLANAVGESNVVTVCRSNYDEAARNGFTIHSTLWGNDLKVRPKVVRTVQEGVETFSGTESGENQSRAFDYILVTAKALQPPPGDNNPSIAELIRPAVTKGRTAIVLVQNGIGIEDEYARLYPHNAILSAVAYLPVTQVSPAVVSHKEVEMLHVGTYPAHGDDGLPAWHEEAARVFVEDLYTSKGRASAKLHEDVQAERWSKLLVNASWNPICALSRLRDGQFMASSAASASANKGEEDEEDEEDAAEMVRGVMCEIMSVAQAYGYGQVDERLVDFQLSRAKKRGLPGVQPSMMTDALAGRRLEADTIVGNVVRLARRKGVSTPMLRTLYALTRGLSRSFELVGERTS